MLNLSRIQSELERAKEKLRSVEETIQKVEGKTFSNGPIRYGGLKNEFHSDKLRNPPGSEDVKNQRRRVIASAVDSRIQRLPADDSPFGLKRGLRDKRESGLGIKRQAGDNRPQGVFARLSGAPFHQADEEDEEDFGKKPSLPSRVYATAAEVPSRQEVIAAQAQDEQSKERNKRMFGALVGTLQKFRKEETRVREREEKRMKVEKKLEENAKREKEKLMQEKRELFLEKKRREVEIKRIEWSLNRVKEYEAWEANVLPLKNFIQTQAKPHIFYLPSTHNAKTEERLAHSQKLVERMIEKRKTNLKEEIENSEKKARKAAAEEAEEEEAENIPEDHEESCNTEQQMQVDFEPKSNKENGYFEGEKTDKTNNSLENPNETKDSDKIMDEENWGVVKEADLKDPTEALEREVHDNISKEKTREPPDSVTNDSSNEPSSPSGGRLNASGDKGSRLDESGENVREEQEAEKAKETEHETSKTDAGEHAEDSSEANPNVEMPSGESEKVTAEEADPDAGKGNDSNLEKSSEETSDQQPPLSECERNADDTVKKVDAEEENKTNESSKKEKSPGRKTNRRSRSPRKSRSPRNSSRNKRRRSSSRQRRVSRRLSSSSSPPKKFRRSRSPTSRRGQKNFASRKRSPHSKTRRRRRTSSRSSSSASLKKKRSRSSSSSSPNSD